MAIERAGVNNVNPGPDVELHTKDQVLLLGSTATLENARKPLLGGDPKHWRGVQRAGAKMPRRAGLSL